MPKRSRKKNNEKKNPAAVALGRLGGLKGGPARMAKLSANFGLSVAASGVAALLCFMSQQYLRHRASTPPSIRAAKSRDLSSDLLGLTGSGCRQ